MAQSATTKHHKYTAPKGAKTMPLPKEAKSGMPKSALAGKGNPFEKMLHKKKS